MINVRSYPPRIRQRWVYPSGEGTYEEMRYNKFYQARQATHLIYTINFIDSEIDA